MSVDLGRFLSCPSLLLLLALAPIQIRSPTRSPTTAAVPTPADNEIVPSSTTPSIRATCAGWHIHQKSCRPVRPPVPRIPADRDSQGRPEVGSCGIIGE